jgi:hypothetical protein
MTTAKAETKSASKPKPNDVPLLQVTRLEQVTALHREPIGAKIFAYGRLLQFNGRRLTPSETREVKDLVKQAIPKRMDNGEYEFDDPMFREQVQKLETQARAKALWLAFGDLFQEQAREEGADVSDLGKITGYIQHLNIADDVLETLYGVATVEPVSLVELTGFSSGSNSPKN